MTGEQSSPATSGSGPGRVGLLAAVTRPHLSLFLADVFTGVVFFLCALVPGLALRAYLNALPAEAGPWIVPLAPLLAFLAFKVANALGAAAWMAVDTVFRYRIYHDVRVRLTERLLRRPGALPPPAPLGDLLSRYRDDTVEVAEVLGKRGLQLLTSSVVNSVATFGILFSIDLRTTLLAVLPTLGMAVIAFAASRRIKELQQQTRQTAGDVSAFLRDCFAGIETIKANRAGEHVVARVRQVNDTRRHAAVRNGVFAGVLASSQNVVIVLGTALVMWVAAGAMREGTFGVGDFAYFVYALGTLGTLVDAVGRFVSRFQRFSVTLDRLREVLPGQRLGDLTRPAPPLPVPSTPATTAPDPPVLAVRGLSYHHPDGTLGLAPTDLTAAAGELVVVRGPVGAGKSTLLRVLQGTLPRSAGSVEVEGRSLPPGVPLSPPMVSLTPQSPRLFSDTVADNVLLGTPPGDLPRLLTLATLDHDLARLPEGTGTLVGPRGHRLSGGQLHRIAAARMLAHPAAVLLVDDLSASLDVDTEHRLLDQLLDAARDSVVVVVSNREPTRRRAHHVLELTR